MKKILVIICLLFSLFGCKTSTESLNVLAPQGAPSLSLLSYVTDHKDKEDYQEPTIVSGPELLASNLMNHDSEFDAIIAPINLGAQLIDKDKTDFKLMGVVSWGNLFVVENPNVDQEGIVLFGEGSVPDVVFSEVLSEKYKDVTVTYVNSAADAQVVLLSNKTRLALLPQPLVSAVLAKNKDLKLVDDVQELWEAKHGSNYPQAALFVKESALNDKSESVDALIGSLKKTSEVMEKDNIESLIGDDIEFYGFNNKDLIVNNASKLSVNFKDVNEAKDAIVNFLNIFNVASDKIFIEENK